MSQVSRLWLLKIEGSDIKMLKEKRQSLNSVPKTSTK